MAQGTIHLLITLRIRELDDLVTRSVNIDTTHCLYIHQPPSTFDRDSTDLRGDEDELSFGR